MACRMMSIHTNVFTFLIFNVMMFSMIQSCFGDCGTEDNFYKNTKIVSDRVACLFPVDGKCPHGMLRVDSDDKGKKACDVRYRSHLVGYTSEDDADPRFCCLLSNTVDLKVKESPCTGGSSRSNIDL